eukprot:1592074-Rhodomonas_salina.2
MSKHDGDCDCGTYFMQRSGDGLPILRGEVRNFAELSEAVPFDSRQKSFGYVLTCSPHLVGSRRLLLG